MSGCTNVSSAIIFLPITVQSTEDVEITAENPYTISGRPKSNTIASRATQATNNTTNDRHGNDEDSGRGLRLDRTTDGTGEVPTRTDLIELDRTNVNLRQLHNLIFNYCTSPGPPPPATLALQPIVPCAVKYVVLCLIRGHYCRPLTIRNSVA